LIIVSQAAIIPIIGHIHCSLTHQTQLKMPVCTSIFDTHVVCCPNKLN